MYRVRSDGSLKTQGEIRQENRNTSFPKTWTPELVDSLGLDPVFDTPQPSVTRYQTAYKDGVELDAKGNWVWKWSVSDMDADAIAAMDANQATAVRADRDRRLAETDWTQVADAPVDQAAWATYRQALRDVPAQAGFPWDITWPTKP